MEKIHPQIQRKTSPRIVLCLTTLIDLIQGPGWNGDDQDLEQRQSDVTRLRGLIEAGHVHLYVPSMLISAVHTIVERRHNIGQAYRVVHALLRFAHITSDVDFECVLEQSNEILLVSEETLDFYDVLPLTYAVALQVDAFIARLPNVLASIYQISTVSLASEIPILPIEAVFQYLSEQDRFLDEGTILVLTPEQHVIPLPQDATPVDFAYKIHSELGHRCVKAFVNGEEVPLSSKLKTGNVVRIAKGDRPLPDPKWLKFVKTRLARRFIRQGWKRFYLEKGWDMLKREIGPNAQLYRPQLERVAQILNQKINQLLVKVGTGDVDIPTLQALMLEHNVFPSEKNPLTEAANTLLDGRPCKLASCCHPFPGDSVMGVLGKNDGVLWIHRSSCQKLEHIPQEQQYKISWNRHVCQLQFSILLRDRADTLRPLLNRLVEDYGLSPDVRSVNIDKFGQCWVVLKLSVRSRKHMDAIISQIRLAPEVRVIKISQNPLVSCPDDWVTKANTIGLFSMDADS